MSFLAFLFLSAFPWYNNDCCFRASSLAVVFEGVRVVLVLVCVVGSQYESDWSWLPLLTRDSSFRVCSYLESERPPLLAEMKDFPYLLSSMLRSSFANCCFWLCIRPFPAAPCAFYLQPWLLLVPSEALDAWSCFRTILRETWLRIDWSSGCVVSAWGSSGFLRNTPDYYRSMTFGFPTFFFSYYFLGGTSNPWTSSTAIFCRYLPWSLDAESLYPS